MKVVKIDKKPSTLYCSYQNNNIYIDDTLFAGD
jgi:hypothetical protein